MTESGAGAGGAGDQAADPPRADQRLRQDRPGGAGPGAARGGRAARLHRLDGEADRGGGGPGHRGRGADRLPRVPGRPGQDAAPARARGHPRRPAAGLAPRAARRARRRAVRAGRRQPLPVPRRPSPRAPPPTSAWSRSTSAARRWSAPRPRTTRRSRSSSTRSATATCSKAVADGASTWPQRKRLAGEAFQHTAAYDVAVAAGSPTATRTPGTGRQPLDPARASPASSARRTPAGSVLRYGENPHQPAALYTDGSGTGLAVRRAAARQGDVLQQLRRHRGRPPRRVRPRRQPCVAIIKHANPCGIAVGADVAEAHRKAHACDPLSAFGGVIAVNRRCPSPWPSRSPRSSPRSSSRPATRTARWRCWPARRTSGCCAAPTAPPRTVEFRPIDGGALLQVKDRLQAAGDDPADWTLATGRAAVRRRAGRPGLRLARLPRGEVQRDPARQGRRDGRRRHGPGQPRRLGEARRPAGRRGAGARLRTPRPTRSSRSPTASRCWPRRASRPSSSRAARSATKQVVEAAKAAGRHDVPHRDAALLPLSPGRTPPSRGRAAGPEGRKARPQCRTPRAPSVPGASCTRVTDPCGALRLR